MFDYIKGWYRRYFTDPQAALLAVLLILGFAIVYFMGAMLAPILAALIISYMLEGSVAAIERRKTPRIIASSLVFIMFIAFMIFSLVVMMPIITRQTGQFIQEFPGMVKKGQEIITNFSLQFPEFISQEAIDQFVGGLTGDITNMGQSVLSISFTSIPTVITYLVLVPLMIFFFLKDKIVIYNWTRRFLPEERTLIKHLWKEMDAQMGNYIRGKVYEIIIIGGAAYVLFQIFGLNYSPLLALGVGLSVLIPYIGAAMVTIPVALVAYFQWGFGTDFSWLIIMYFVLQFLDGNVLVPVLFSDVVNLHPVAIIAAIVVFGGLWGFWGVFFAIPLATLVKALINIWPTLNEDQVMA
jgi:putative permease